MANVSRAAPRIDRVAIGAAIDEHRCRLRLPRLDVRVMLEDDLCAPNARSIVKPGMAT